MTFTPGNSRGNFNSTTPVTIVSAPGAATQRIIKEITVYNKDTAVITVTISEQDTATNYEILSHTLAVGDTLVYTTNKILDSTSKSIVGVLGGAVTLNQPTFTADWGDNS